ncbi:Nuclear export mediator factor Nemf isoform 2 [Schistosoma japonicum]|uniref:Nuclear export mediator factor Nemf isoform 2 n=1 Tax=Schistosoma japonicum TaxID=6182 RepID=A0A4Z2DFE2_SCHJA|nr:Nuclear export mediator factor Nemf isoform 2 [Schistosoma japonicum]
MEQILDISLLRAQTNICVTFRTRMKLLFTSYDVMVSISEIKNQILGHRVINVYDVDNKTCLLKLASTKSDEKTILLLESGSRIHITDYDWPKNMMPSGFSMKLRKHIRNKKIVDVCQIGADRVVDIQIGYESSAYHLILELYDRGNMLLTDDTFTILHLLRPRTDKNQNIRFAAHEIYPIASCRQILKCFQDLSDQNSLTDIEDFLIPLFQSSKGPWKSNIQTCDKPYVNKTLSLELPYGNVVIEHCMRIAQKEVKQAKTINDFQLESSETYLMKLYVKHFAVALRDILLGPYSIDHQSSLKGYIFGKPHQSTEKGLQSYEEFHPFMFEQYREKPHLAFDSFNRAVDAFFSKIESQKTLGQISRNEQKANRKVENIKKDQERRIMLLKTEQELDMQKAYLIEANRQLVDNIIILINHALSNQIDWKELELIIEEAKQRNDPLSCHIVELKLQTSQAVIRLKDPFENQSDVNDDTLIKSDKKDGYTEVVIDIDVNALTNARKYYDKKRAASKKEEKTKNVSRKVLKSAIHKAEATMKTAKTIAQITEVRKPMWFEKFFWFISSENYLVVAGHDSQQNEVLVKRYLKSGDIFVHADIHGASTVIIKARHLTSEESDFSKHESLLHLHRSLPLPPPKTLLEAANMAVVLSSAWQSHVLTRAWWVHHDQVSKTAPSGEYLTSGSFIIRGKKNYLPPCPFDYGFGIMFKLHEDSVFKHKGERRIVVVNTPFSESSTCQVESSAFLNDEEHTEFPDAILQLDLAKDLPSHKDPDVVEIISENPSRKNKIKNKKVEKPKPNKKANNPPNLNKENIEKCEKLNKEPVPFSQQSLKRGQKSKLKKIKQKYKEQDEEERSLRMRILQGDDAKPSQYHQILERDHSLNQVKTSNSILDTQTVCDSDVIRNDQPDNNANLDIDDHFTESDDGSEESLRCSDVDNLKSKDNDDGDDDEDLSSESKDDLISLLNSLTGQPNDDDLLLYAIPVCAPYSVLLKFKFRVKLNPGNTKRGKASKMALFQFISDKSATNRERELIRAMKIEEVSRNFPGCVKITLPQIKSSLNK